MTPIVQAPGIAAGLEGMLFAGGGFRPATGTYTVACPAVPGLELHPADTDVDAALAVAQEAAQAWPGWAATPAMERVRYVRRLAGWIKANRDDLVAMIVCEAAKPVRHARGEVDFCLRVLETLCASAAEVSAGSRLDFATGRRVTTLLRPVGPALLVTPWNFPVNLGVRKLATALIAGCTFVWKPAERTPLSALLVARGFEAIGLPPGVASVLPTSQSPEVTRAMMRSGLLRKLSFTGSTAVGKQLMAEASHQLMRASFELGGNAPAVLGTRADLPTALEAVLGTKFVNSGQVCTTVNRLYVPAASLGDTVDYLGPAMDKLGVGWPQQEDTTVGPLISQQAATSLDEALACAAQRGGTITRRGTPAPAGGNFVQPALVHGLTTDDPLSQRELFGPVINVLTYADLDDAVEQANATPYGLSAYVFSEDAAERDALALGMRAGMVAMNSGASSSVSTPFGGVGWSGTGRENGVRGLTEFLDETTLVH